MRLGIFGGTFDPIHYGHLLLAECCLESHALDAVWFMLAATPPHKQEQPISPGDVRLEMLNLALAGHPTFLASTLELDRGGLSYTVDTLAQILEEDSKRELFLLLGADSWQDLPNWHQPQQVCELATPIVVNRGGETVPDFSLADHFLSPKLLEQIRQLHVQMPAMDLTSSGLRARTQAGQSLRYRTPAAVQQYIQQHQLYQLPGSE